LRDGDRDAAAAGPTRANDGGHGSGLDAGRVVIFSWLIAGVTIGVLNQLHVNLHEHHDLPPVIHWLRDASLAVPLAAIAVVGAAIVVRARRSDTGDGRSIMARLGWAVLAALIFAILTVPGIQAHAVLFGAQEDQAVGWLEHGMTEGTIALQVSLAALVPAALLLGPPWRAARSPHEPAQAPGRSHLATSGHSASLVTTGTVRVGGDR